MKPCLLIGRLAMALLLVVLSAAASGTPEKAGDVEGGAITIFSAASLTEVVTAWAAEYERTAHVKAKCSFNSSAILARQVEAGAAADVFISADPAWTDYLDKKGLLLKDSTFEFARNVLALVAPVDEPIAFVASPGADLGRVVKGRLAVGEPDSVPVGKYAKQALEWMQCWETMKLRLAPMPDVRSVLRIVATGETNAGIVYRTDAMVEPRVKVVCEFPEASHQPIIYAAARCKGAKKGAEGFVALMKSEGGREMLKQHGFTPITEGK